MNVGRSFDASAAIYDRARRQLVPCLDAFYGAALALADFPSEAPLRVLDLGAGTGLMTSFFAAAFPAAQFTLVDVAGEMLEIARDRFAARGARFEFLIGDFAKAGIGREHDLVISALAIHHLDDPGKRALFSRVYGALRPGGLFINADQVLGRTPAVTERNRRAWLGAAHRLGVSEGDLAAAIERMKYDRMAKLEDQLRWLEDAGFTDVDCAFKDGMFAVLSGRR
jgi:tRNA (cmo5U34)-methyltransferase